MIETARLVLRPYVIDDHAPYLRMCSDPEVVRYIGGQTLSAEEAWNRLLRYVGHWTLFGYGLFAVIEKASGDYIGETGLADFHRGLGDAFDGHPEAAWVFRQDVGGHGYAFEAAEAVHGWFGTRFGARRTVCLIDPDNRRSLRLAAKLGYRPFGATDYRGSSPVMLECDAGRVERSTATRRPAMSADVSNGKATIEAP